MKLQWTSKALDDLARLHAFLYPANPETAAKTVQALTRAAGQLSRYPRIGERLDQFTANEVRRIIVGNYEMRYEIREAVIYVARLWHTRESR
jgi:plasmid stabilization system protein ParE